MDGYRRQISKRSDYRERDGANYKTGSLGRAAIFRRYPDKALVRAWPQSSKVHNHQHANDYNWQRNGNEQHFKYLTVPDIGTHNHASMQIFGHSAVPSHNAGLIG
jgi:hypothetical protein